MRNQKRRMKWNENYNIIFYNIIFATHFLTTTTNSMLKVDYYYKKLHAEVGYIPLPQLISNKRHDIKLNRDNFSLLSFRMNVCHNKISAGYKRNEIFSMFVYTKYEIVDKKQCPSSFGTIAYPYCLTNHFEIFHEFAISMEI